MQAQTEQSWTRHPSSNRTASDRTFKLRLDIPPHKGQHQTKRIPDKREGPDHIRPDTCTQTGLAQLDIPTHTRQASDNTVQRLHSSPDQTATKTRHPDSDRTASDQTFKLRLHSHSLRPNIPAQTGKPQTSQAQIRQFQTRHSSADRKASINSSQIRHSSADRKPPDLTTKRKLNIPTSGWTASRGHPSSDLTGQL